MKVTKDELAELAKEVLHKASTESFSPKSPRGSSVPKRNLAPDFSSRTFRSGHQATIIALRGDLGAGKTTFTQALARELGITDVVQSPTYVLMKSYPINFKQFKNLIHIDAYRLDKPEEFSALKPETFLNNPENLIVIEWPERVEGHLPTPDILLNFSHVGQEHEREVNIEK